MTDGAATRRQVHAPPRFGIGQVLAKLQPEFPELTPSKLRFLEEQGLVTPARTAAGYRKFSPDDIERLSVVLAMQRDHYLPLKVIRAHLDAVDRGETPALPGATSGATVRATANRYTRSELLDAADATPKLLDDAIAASMLRPADLYGDDSLEVLRALVALRTAGIEPRHLRGMRGSAERQAALIERAIAPERRRDAAGRARNDERAGELAGHLAAVHASLLRRSIGSSSD